MKQQLYNSLKWASWFFSICLFLSTSMDLIGVEYRIVIVPFTIGLWGSCSVFILVIPFFLLYKEFRTSGFYISVVIMFCLISLGLKYQFLSLPGYVILLASFVMMVYAGLGWGVFPEFIKNNNPKLAQFLSKNKSSLKNRNNE